MAGEIGVGGEGQGGGVDADKCGDPGPVRGIARESKGVRRPRRMGAQG